HHGQWCRPPPRPRGRPTAGTGQGDRARRPLRPGRRGRRAAPRGRGDRREPPGRRHPPAGPTRPGRRVALRRVRGVVTAPFEPPPYPYERLDRLKPHVDVDLSIGTPCDPPPPALLDALASSNSERGYPPSVGSAALKDAARGWMRRRVGVDVPGDALAAFVG